VRTVEWPPRVRNGRLRYVDGVEAASTTILMIVSDLRQQPFNPDGLALGDITFKTQTSARPLIETALRRLAPLISVESVGESTNDDGSVSFTITYTDRESRSRGEVRVG
jgi:hypothetical protein